MSGARRGKGETPKAPCPPRACGGYGTLRILKPDLEPELNLPFHGAAQRARWARQQGRDGADRGVPDRGIRVRELRMVQEIECFNPELRGVAADLRILGERRVDVERAGSADDSAAGVPERSRDVGGRHEARRVEPAIDCGIADVAIAGTVRPVTGAG